MTQGDEYDRQILEDFVVDNPELERLEVLLGQFNIFEAVGMARQELRHSDFLAFLLNPQQPHGLGDAFLRKFLQRALLAARGAGKVLPISLVDLDVWGLDDVLVLREWNSIDLLILSEKNQLAIIIENKISTGEHSGQLKRYHRIVTQHYADWNLLPLFLTPEGSMPSDEEYLPVDYRQVASLLEEIITSRAASLGGDVQALLRHYVQMLRRYIVSDSEIDDLCRRIYQKHQRALDLIYERRPDQQAALYDFLKKLISDTDGFALDYHSKKYISFAATAWDGFIPKEGGNNWSNQGRVIRFWFENVSGRLRLILEIGPGPQDLRRKLFDIAQAHKPLFKPSTTLYPQYSRIYNRVILGERAYEDADTDSLTTEILKQWQVFLTGDFVRINDHIATGMLERTNE